MAPDPLRDRITDQYSYTGDRAEVWRGFDLVLDTTSFLNLGYSPWYLPYAVGSSQRRLAAKAGRLLAAELASRPTAPRGGTAGVRLLDVGCGRGGPAIEFATRFGFRVTGVDLVPYNVARATANARDRGVDAQFVVGDATSLPVRADAFAACASLDSFVYVPDRPAAFAAVADALEPGGVLVCTDLVTSAPAGGRDTDPVPGPGRKPDPGPGRKPDPGPGQKPDPGPGQKPDPGPAPRLGRGAGRARPAVDAFADAWDMPPLSTAAEYRRWLRDAGFAVHRQGSLTRHSVGRFRRWTAAFLGLLDSPVGPLVAAALRRYGLDPAAVRSHVERAHEALPHLEHVAFVAVR